MDLKDWLTFLVGAGLLSVAYAQWRTANQKVVVDLFDRRVKVLEALRSAIGQIAREGEADPEASQAFTRAQVDAEFLFGPEVKTYLEGIALDIIKLRSYRVISERDAEFSKKIEMKGAIFERIVDFYKTSPPIFAPYIELTQKNTPFWRPW